MKERSEAQREADKRYRERNPNKDKNIQFGFPATEAKEIIAFIKGTGLKKADFLRRAIKLYRRESANILRVDIDE